MPAQAKKKTAKKPASQKRPAKKAPAKKTAPKSAQKSAKKPQNAPKKTKANNNSAKQPKATVSPRVRAIWFATLAAIFTALIFFKGQHVWAAIRSFFFGLFGLAIVLVPVFFVYLCIITEKEKNVARFKIKVILCILTVLFSSASVYLIDGAEFNDGTKNFFSCLSGLYLQASGASPFMNFSCGMIGGILGYPMAELCGSGVALIPCILLTAACLSIVADISIKDVTAVASRKMHIEAEKIAANHKARREMRLQQQNQGQIPNGAVNQQYQNTHQKQNQRIMQDSRQPQSEHPEQQHQYPAKKQSPSKMKKQMQKQMQMQNQMQKQLQTQNSVSNVPNVPNFNPGEFSGHIDIPLGDVKKKRNKKQAINNAVVGLDVDYTESNEPNAEDKDLSADLINIINRASKPVEKQGESTVEDIAGDISQEKISGILVNNVNGLNASEAERKSEEDSADKPAGLENAGYMANISNEEKKEEKVYRFPPIQLLKPSNNNNDRSAMEEMQNNSKKLIETLHSFGVNANITNICRGPSVTRYELQPAPGVKISKITNLSDDIALNLAANGVRIEAPIPGKAAVGIEVPNKVVSMVSMRELIDSEKFRRAKSKLTCVLGRDITGDIVVTDLAKMPHLLIAGTTGSGKSVCVNSILMSILFKATPDEVKLLLIDPKMVEFSKYKGIPHLLIPVVSDAKKAAGALSWAVNEMLQRYKIFSEFDCKDIDSYNALIDKNLEYISYHPPVQNEEGEMIQPVMEVNGLPVAKEKMSRVVIAIDELADLMMAAPSEVEDSICRLAQMARAAGMHLILATQRPTVNVITGLIKANVPSRISLRVSSNMDSRTILDQGGGEKLIGRGDMLFSPVGAPKPMRVQGCYASDAEIEGVTSYIKKSYSAQYNADIEEKIKRIATEEIAAGKKSGNNSDDDGLDVDSKMDEAIQCVIEAGQASTSLLQRRLKVGYARAGRMIDDMEQLGIVGPHQGSKPRDVLMTYNEWLERRNVLQNRSE